MEQEIDTQPGVLDTDAILVRDLRPGDLDAIVRIDERIVGRARRRFYEIKFRDAFVPGSLRISLAVEEEGSVVGFLLGSLYYGEFGQPEPAAVLDTIAVDPDRRGRKIGKALVRQLLMNMRALGIARIRTEVDWDQFDLMSFLAHEGFVPARRLCLETDLSRST
jgi:predicted N-acetyltransferase YhbS